jgi:sec-independent protein translocase protein TatC
MSFLEHLDELRKRLIVSVSALGVGFLVSWAYVEKLVDFIFKPLSATIKGGKFQYIEPGEGFMMRMKLAALAGLFLALPIILWQIWQFVTPGLYAHERRYAIPFVVSALVLFLLGAGLAYYTLPRALQFLVQIGGDDLITAFAPGKYFTLITYMMLAFGIGFEFPILLIFLQMAGILSVGTLRRGRRYAIVGICVLVAVITPSGDPISMLMLSVPLVIFYEVSIIAGRVIERRRTAAEPA